MTKDIQLYKTKDGMRVMVYLDEILANKDLTVYVCGVVADLNMHIAEGKVIDVLDTTEHVISTVTSSHELRGFLEARGIICA